MCGIVGYSSNTKTDISSKLIKMLSRLEYRGYDSSGLAIYNDDITIVKSVGNISKLKKKVKSEIMGTSGIAHTRWATHGEPSELNCHPHVSNNGYITIVHNGIIENYLELKSQLVKLGYKFYSDTDTEVAANWIEYIIKANPNQLVIYSIIDACKSFTGVYSFVILLKDGSIIGVCHGAPLVLDITHPGSYKLASDICAFNKGTHDVVYLKSGEYVCINDKLSILDDMWDEINIFPTQVTIDEDVSEFPTGTIMKNEINSDWTATQTAVSNWINKYDGEFADILSKNKIDNILIVGCGTAYHAGLVIQQVARRFGLLNIEVEIASEFIYQPIVPNNSTLGVVISQSGETADTISALRILNDKATTTIAICNVKNSTIDREAKYTFYTESGIEVAVASTKAFLGQISILYGMLLEFMTTYRKVSLSKLCKIYNIYSNIWKSVKSITENKFNLDASKYTKVFFLGKLIDSAIAKEGALKLKEVSYIPSEAFTSGELKHGPIALVDEDTLVVMISTDDKLASVNQLAINEVMSRGADVLLITNKFGPLTGLNVDIITVDDKSPYYDDIFSPFISTVIVQKLAYNTSIKLGLNPDKPRNLAKSVTVA